MTAGMKDLVKAVKDHAVRNYEKDGWDYIVETYSHEDIAELIEDANAGTVGEAINAVLEMAKILNDNRADVMAEVF